MPNKMIPWDVVIEILNKLQTNNPGVTMEHVNKYVNDEIYEWFNEQPFATCTEETSKDFDDWYTNYEKNLGLVGFMEDREVRHMFSAWAGAYNRYKGDYQ